MFFSHSYSYNSTRNGDKNHPQWNLCICAGHLLIGGYNSFIPFRSLAPARLGLWGASRYEPSPPNEGPGASMRARSWWWQLKYFWTCSSRTLGARWTHFDYIIFFKGVGKNHQPDNIESSFKNQLQRLEGLVKFSWLNLPKNWGVVKWWSIFTPFCRGWHYIETALFALGRFNDADLVARNTDLWNSLKLTVRPWKWMVGILGMTYLRGVYDLLTQEPFQCSETRISFVPDKKGRCLPLT